MDNFSVDITRNLVFLVCHSNTYQVPQTLLPFPSTGFHDSAHGQPDTQEIHSTS